VSSVDDSPENPDRPTGFWPLERVVVRGLLGNPRELVLELEPDITVLTGENGSGKSTLLRAINLAGTGDWYSFSSLPLEFMTLVFSGGYELQIDNQFEPPTLQGGRHDPWTPPELEPDEPGGERPTLSAESELEWLRLEEERYLSREFAESEEFRNRLAHRQTGQQRRGVEGDPVELDRPEWVKEFEQGVRIAFVTTRRLEDVRRLRYPGRVRTFKADQPRSRIELLSDSLIKTARAEIIRFTEASNKADRDFPQKVVKAMEIPGPISPESLELEVESLEGEVRELAASLSRVGLLPGARDEVLATEARGKSDAVLLFLREFYSDRLSRLLELDELKRVLEVFSAFAADRFSGKQVSVSASEGLVVTLDSGNRIEPHKLSSGEQQLIVIAYQLLFRTKPGSVVLIDEPELSLHVSWLRGLIEAFREIGEIRQLQYLIATHSPSLVAGHDERERSLDLLMSS